MARFFCCKKILRPPQFSTLFLGFAFQNARLCIPKCSIASLDATAFQPSVAVRGTACANENKIYVLTRTLFLTHIKKYGSENNFTTALFTEITMSGSNVMRSLIITRLLACTLANRVIVSTWATLLLSGYS